MKRTGAATLLITAVLGAGAGFLLDQLLTANGQWTFTPASSLPVLLIALGVVDVVFALPIRRATRGASGSTVDPFRALRIAMLAKASSIVGAAVGGFSLGLLLFVTTRPVMPSLGSMATTIATLVCAAVLVAAGLVAEHLCTIGKDDDDQQPGGDDPGLTPRLHDH